MEIGVAAIGIMDASNVAKLCCHELNLSVTWSRLSDKSKWESVPKEMTKYAKIF